MRRRGALLGPTLLSVKAAALRIDLRLPQSGSLKDKRAIVRTIVDGARNRYRVASAEVGYLDLRQRTEVGFAVVGGDGAHLTDVLDRVERFVWSFPDVEVLDAHRSWMEEEEDG